MVSVLLRAEIQLLHFLLTFSPSHTRHNSIDMHKIGLHTCSGQETQGNPPLHLTSLVRRRSEESGELGQLGGHVTEQEEAEVAALLALLTAASGGGGIREIRFATPCQHQGRWISRAPA